ncbi:LRR receptor kinase SERK2 isoform X1 [Dendrobium catenatum]|uniref:LRR receptor kinase SERK2 isoform X1 n=2 Tax=Dendrobium catenatum TaxID=906689 RepID=UPI0009F667F7|nr:LRR receptor kinase SERK2 isoform X1 [Dendrobium catenatum]
MNGLKLFSLIFVLTSLHHTTEADNEGDALLALKLSLNASEIQLSSWAQQNVEKCTWEAVNCDNNSNVVRVELSSMRFTGVLSPRIGELKHLEALFIGNNSITGGIPAEFGNLASLRTLNLENNRLSGSIPSSLGRLQNLQTLRLAFNNLTGKIPERLFNIPSYNFTGNKLNCGQGYQYLCASVLLNQGRSHNFKTRLILGSIGGAVSFLLTGIVCLLCMTRRKSRKHEVFVDVPGEDYRLIALDKLKRFTWQELQQATENFAEKNVVGQGGYGKVYKGVLQGNMNIAVKRLKDGLSSFNESSYLHELEMISIAVHQNLLRLIGFCTTASERLLVYPFMPNLSVDYHLRELKPEDPVLDWSTRKRVALGTARALSYLHESCNPKIIHRDVKAANVLLDENFEAVVGDFGLAKLVDMKKTSVTTQIRGTQGHIAPEYIATGRASEKTDVFGYGIMLLELVTGQSAICFEGRDDLLLLDHVRRMERENHLNSIVDRNLRQNYNHEEVEMMIRVALLCTQTSPKVRPSMSKVLQMLEGEMLAEKWEEWQELVVARAGKCKDHESQ